MSTSFLEDSTPYPKARYTVRNLSILDDYFSIKFLWIYSRAANRSV